MNAANVRAKFGDDYTAGEDTFRMGIDLRLAERIAERFRGRTVLETCTGAGFTAMPLARVAAHVISIEIDPVHQEQAKRNVHKAGLLGKVTFISGDILDERVWASLPPFDAAFLDPDWAVTGPSHVHHFIRSSTRPPADALLERVMAETRNTALVLPPEIDLRELAGLPPHERQKLFLDGRRELYCLYFGELAATTGDTELRV